MFSPMVEAESQRRVSSIFVGISLFGAVMLGNILVTHYYALVSWPPSFLLLTACLGAVLGTFLLGLLRYFDRRAARESHSDEERPAPGGVIVVDALPRERTCRGQGWWSAIILAYGLGLLTAGCWLAALNGMYDHSPPAYLAVRVIGVDSNTELYLIREYHLKYMDGRTNERDLLITRAQFDRLKSSRRATLEIHAGAMGWPWIKDVVPES